MSSRTTKQFTIHAKVVRNITVTVEARTVEEARQKFDSMDWVDEQHGETTDWEMDGEPREDT